MIGIDDDCAQVAAPEGSFIVTTDVMVEDQHFHLSWSTGYEVGARVAAQNLADIDAMGGRPSALVASVVAPRDMDADVFLDVVRGLGDRAREVGAGVVGGDLSAGEKLVISITAFGYCRARWYAVTARAPVTWSRSAAPLDIPTRASISWRVGTFPHPCEALMSWAIWRPSLRRTVRRGLRWALAWPPRPRALAP